MHYRGAVTPTDVVTSIEHDARGYALTRTGRS